MTVVQKTGDIFTSQAGILAHECNLRGGISSIVGKVFARFPEAFTDYFRTLDGDYYALGDINVVETSNKIIVNMFTRERPRSEVDFEHVKIALHNLHTFMEKKHLSAAMPKITEGFGDSNWDDIQKIIEEEFHDSDLSFEVWDLDE